MAKTKRITNKDLDRLAETHPKLVEHYRHIKKEALEYAYGSETIGRLSWIIYRQARQEILDLLSALDIRKGGDKP